MSTDGVAWSDAYRERFGILPGDAVSALHYRASLPTSPPRGDTPDDTARRRADLLRDVEQHEQQHGDDARRAARRRQYASRARRRAEQQHRAG